MNWLASYRKDISRYTEYSKGPWLIEVLMQQGLWTLFYYRLLSSIYRSKVNKFLKKILILLFYFPTKTTEIMTKISLPYTAVIGEGLYIGHFGTIILNPKTEIGIDCNISPGVVIGVSGKGKFRGTPRIGDRVYIGSNAVVVGSITVGNDAVIGGNSLVNRDVPSHTTVIGVPAKVVSQNGSEEYIHPKGE
jgi:serine O-acetyltransferase